jgi:hypothetical protein
MRAFYIISSILTDGSGTNQVNLPKVGASSNSIHLILQIVFSLAGAVAFLVMTIAAFLYTISRGEPQEINKQKDTIIYALVGLAVCALAFSLVTFVFKSV